MVTQELCANCSAELVGDFCHRCGEKRFSPSRRRLGAVVGDVLGGLFHFDGKLPRTLRTLFRYPGKLSAEWSAGRRVPYTKPVALFLVTNVLFFFVQPHAKLLGYGFDEYYGRRELAAGAHGGWTRRWLDERLAQTHESVEDYRERFDRALQSQKKTLFITFIPLFALLLALLYRRSERTFVEHLVFAIHYEVAFLAWLLGVLLLCFALPWGLGDRVLFAPLPWIGGEGTFMLFLLATLGLHLYCALRRFYGGSPPVTAINVVLLFAGQVLALALYKQVVFFAAYATA